MGCKTADFLIKRGLQAPGAPPFIGQIPLDDAARERAITRTRQFLGGQPDRLPALFRQFPNLAVWLVSHSLSEEYGEDGHAVYKHIANILGVPLNTQRQRDILFDAFCGVCERLGLPTRGSHRQVDVYLLHAGVSHAQLPYLINAFIKQEAAFGPPPVETTLLLNRWEEDALYFLPPAVTVLRRAILWDETAWHAALFARLRENAEAFVPKTEFEEHFKDVFRRLHEARPSSCRGESESIAPRLRLAWQSGELVLRLPRIEGRIRLWLDDASQPLRLRGGEDWALPQPWPRHIRWELAGHQGRLDFLPPQGFAVFDRITGYLLRDVHPGTRDVALDSAELVIVARERFCIADEAALTPEPETFVCFVNVSSQPVTLRFKNFQITLTARPRRRLFLVGDEIADGPRGVLYGPAARLRIETGLRRAETRTLRITLAQQSTLVNTTISEDGFGEMVIEDLLRGFAGSEEADPLRLRVDLMAPSAEGSAHYASGIALSAWVWPGFRSTDGIVFDSRRPPRNLVIEECQYVRRDSQGRLCLDSAGGYATARAVFAIEGAHVPFDVPWPDIAIIRRRAGGLVSYLPLGARLSVNEDDRFDTICIRCPDPRAELIVRGRGEFRPFAGGLARSLALRDLLAPAADGRVLIRRASGAEVLLFEVVATLAPQRVTFFPAAKGVRLRLHFREPIDALAAEIEDEVGKVILAEAALRHRPVATRQPDWFHAEVCLNDALAAELAIRLDGLHGGTSLARLLVRPEGHEGWRPLRDAGGRTFAVALAGPETEGALPCEDLIRRFETLCRWLVDCYAVECWEQIERKLVRRWRGLGGAVHATPGGEGAIMRAAALPPPDHAPQGWVPVLHPLQFFPNLYAAPPPAFAALRTASDPGAVEMAALATLEAAPLEKYPHLHPTVYLAFRNAEEAQRSGVPLTGFDPSRFFSNLPQLDLDPSAGWFWRGTPLLGPAHWRAAHLRFVDRIKTADLFTEDTAEGGPNNRRQEALQRLMHAAWTCTSPTLRPPAPPRGSDTAEPALVDLWASALLSGFARASRFGDVSPYLEKLAPQAGVQETDALTSLAFLLRLAPELFAFHLLLWQIAKEHP